MAAIIIILLPLSHSHQFEFNFLPQMHHHCDGSLTASQPIRSIVPWPHSFILRNCAPPSKHPATSGPSINSCRPFHEDLIKVFSRAPSRHAITVPIELDIIPLTIESTRRPSRPVLDHCCTSRGGSMLHQVRRCHANQALPIAVHDILLSGCPPILATN